MAERTLTIRGVPDATLKRLRAQAEASRRSLNGQLLVILEHAAASAAADQAGPLSATVPGVHEPAPASGSVSTALEAVDAAALEAVCRRHRITWLAVFGSLARGDARPDSDADVVVDFEPGMTPGFGIVRVAAALRPVFGGRRVDLLTRRELGRLREHVQHSLRTLYAAE